MGRYSRHRTDPNWPPLQRTEGATPALAWAGHMLAGNECNAVFNTNLPQEPVFWNGIYYFAPNGECQPFQVWTDVLSHC